MTQQDKERQEKIYLLLISDFSKNLFDRSWIEINQLKLEHQLAFNKRWMEWFNSMITYDEKHSYTIYSTYSLTLLTGERIYNLQQSRKDLIKLEGWKYVE